jgi:uncharacterized SAM-binding protein YcdF (DUF218 family)
MTMSKKPPPINEEVRNAGRIIWDYLRLGQPLRAADIMLVACSNDLRVAEYAAELYKDGWAPLVLFSGGIAHQNDLLSTGWDIPEADVFAESIIASGIPASAILKETEARNTGENIRFSAELLEISGVDVRTVLLVQKPYMERRIQATVEAQHPKWDVTVTSPPIEFENAPIPSQGITLPEIIHIIAGDLQRVRDYPSLGFQSYQFIPEQVTEAWQYLVSQGFDRHLST